MTAVAFHNQAATTTTLQSAKAMDSQSSDSTDAATISANDFLTLLVTEMKNQDPTANTDPNEYINQLVNVNSLEQLISINQTLSTAIDPSASGDGQSAGSAPHGAADSGAVSPATESHRPLNSQAHSVPGNLGIPAFDASAQRVASSLSGSHHPISLHPVS
jgi:flagellar basal-body rod modification protein FlgD